MNLGNSTGNITLNQIIQMQIKTLGNQLFDDEKFISTKGEPEWKNFRQKLQLNKGINLETTLLVEKRLSRTIEKINRIIFGVDETESTEIFDNATDKEKYLLSSVITFQMIFLDFFLELKKNISNCLPCNVPQDKIVQYTFVKHICKIVNLIPTIGNRSDPRSNDEKITVIEAFFQYFFEKNDKGIYEPSIKNATKDITEAFKRANVRLDDLKSVVDTDKGQSLLRPSTTWKTLKTILEGDIYFEKIEKTAVSLYRMSYFCFFLLTNFRKVTAEYIPDISFSRMIESLSVNFPYLKSLRDLAKNEECPWEKKQINSALDYILCEEKYYSKDLSLEYFFMTGGSSDDMRPIVSYKGHCSYIDYIWTRSSVLVSKYFLKEKYDRNTEMYFCEQICCKERMGVSSEFFYKLYSARIAYADWCYKKVSIGDVSTKYLEAYDSSSKYAGHYLKQFIEEALKVFLEEYKETKKTGRIKEIYQYAVAVGLTPKLYDDFKAAEFPSSSINPDEMFIRLWDMGHDVLSISGFTGLTWQTVRHKLIENKKYLKRNDVASLNDLERYISKWDCDEYGIDSDEDWY